MDATTTPIELDRASTTDSIPSRTEMLGWFVKHPSMYREFGRMTRNPNCTGAEDPARSSHRRGTGRGGVRGVVHPARRGLTRARLGPGHPARRALPRRVARGRATNSRVPVAMGGAANVELLYDLVRLLRPDRVLETGVALGWSSLAILLAFESLGHGELGEHRHAVSRDEQRRVRRDHGSGAPPLAVDTDPPPDRDI